MGSIRVLPDQLINQIAAGEVIERPASIVKELVENSVDAGAKQVTVEIVKGGVESIVVTDDGQGMDEMDARLAFERHATSKIRTSNDLFNIKSLGFRGEALASIAAVSEVVLQTKTASSLGGIRLEMKGGKEPVVTAAGCPVGTKLSISNLFFNTPARKKYLKSERTEYRHVLETVQDLALAHPEVGFRFVSNGRTIFDLLKTDEIQARIGALFGRSISEEMVSIFYGGRDLQVSGYVGKPHTARTTRKYQYFIINGRPVQDHRLGYAVKEAYSNLIPSSQHPIFVINITVDPEQVDVNVHPRKLEVRFSNPQDVFRVLKSSVHAALGREPMTPNMPLRDKHLDTPAFLRKASIVATERKRVTVEETGGDYDPKVATPQAQVKGSFGGNLLGGSPSVNVTPSEQTRAFGNWNAGAGSGGASIFGRSSTSQPSTQGGASPLGAMGSSERNARKAYLIKKRAKRLIAQGKTEEAARLMASIGEGLGTGVTGSAESPPLSNMSSRDDVSSSLGDDSETSDSESILGAFHQSYRDHRPAMGLQPLAQVKQSYIVAEDAEGIVIIDQHAAHERVMLGKFRANESNRQPAKQPLLTPLPLELDFREKAILEENLELLQSLGFEIGAFGGNTYAVEAIPDFLAKDNIDTIMKGFLDDLLNEQSPRAAARRHDHILHTLACRAAAKFGRRLSHQEQQALIQSLLQTDGSNACAHGRPTMIRLSFNELEQKFGRKG